MVAGLPAASLPVIYLGKSRVGLHNALVGEKVFRRDPDVLSESKWIYGQDGTKHTYERLECHFSGNNILIGFIYSGGVGGFPSQTSITTDSWMPFSSLKTQRTVFVEKSAIINEFVTWIHSKAFAKDKYRASPYVAVAKNSYELYYTLSGYPVLVQFTGGPRFEVKSKFDPAAGKTTYSISWRRRQGSRIVPEWYTGNASYIYGGSEATSVMRSLGLRNSSKFLSCVARLVEHGEF